MRFMSNPIRVILVAGALLFAGGIHAAYVDLVRGSSGFGMELQIAKLEQAIQPFDMGNIERLGRAASGTPLAVVYQYYAAGIKGDLRAIEMLHVPTMRDAIKRQYREPQQLKESFGDLSAVKIDAALSWSGYRAVLVRHSTKAQPEVFSSWVHILECQASSCLFSDAQAPRQFGGQLLGQAYRYGVEAKPPQKSILVPGFGPVGKGSAQWSLYSQVPSAVERERLALFAKSIDQTAKLIQESGELASLFVDGKRPGSAVVFRAPNRVDDFSYSATLGFLSTRRWSVAMAAKVDAARSLVILKDEMGTAAIPLLLNVSGPTVLVETRPDAFVAWSVIGSDEVAAQVFAASRR